MLMSRFSVLGWMSAAGTYWQGGLSPQPLQGLPPAALPLALLSFFSAHTALVVSNFVHSSNTLCQGFANSEACRDRVVAALRQALRRACCSLPSTQGPAQPLCLCGRGRRPCRDIICQEKSGLWIFVKEKFPSFEGRKY